MNLQGIMLSEKQPVPKGYKLYGSVYITFLKNDNILEVEKRLVISRV